MEEEEEEKVSSLFSPPLGTHEFPLEDDGGPVGGTKKPKEEYWEMWDTDQRPTFSPFSGRGRDTCSYRGYFHEPGRTEYFKLEKEEEVKEKVDSNHR